ncbi:MAG: AI-2E family transporter [Candidatus Riflebacteria bacterium]|nr:AI-2E family transporter [Candidatus Riflebacteria bacterium]
MPMTDSSIVKTPSSSNTDNIASPTDDGQNSVNPPVTPMVAAQAVFLRDLPLGAKNVLILVGGLLAIWIIYSLAGIIAPVLVSLVLAYILNPVVRFLERPRLPRPWAVLLLYVFGILAGVLVVVPLTLQIISETHDLSTRLASINVEQVTQVYKIKLKDSYDRYSQSPWLKSYLDIPFNDDRIRELAVRGVVIAKDFLLNAVQKVLGFVFSTFSSMASLLLLPLLTFYLLIDLDLFYQRGLLLVPPGYRPSIDRICRDIDNILSAFLRGQMLSAMIFATLMTIMLSICGLRFAVLLGPIAGVANLIPYLGGLVTVILSSLVAFSQHGISQDCLIMLVKIGVGLAIVQGIDGMMVQPKVIGENVGLHPVIVIIALILGGSLYGILGMLLSVPTTCILKVLSAELYAELYDQT